MPTHHLTMPDDVLLIDTQGVDESVKNESDCDLYQTRYKIYDTIPHHNNKPIQLLNNRQCYLFKQPGLQSMISMLKVLQGMHSFIILIVSCANITLETQFVCHQ